MPEYDLHGTTMDIQDITRRENKVGKDTHYFLWLLYAPIKSDRMKHWLIIKQYAAAAMWKYDTALRDLRASLSRKQSGLSV